MRKPFKSVLCVAAHPDDLEFSVGGSVAVWVSEGVKVYYLILTNGNKGSQDRTLKPVDIKNQRRKEQRKAGRILGVQKIFFCDFEDGALKVSQAVKFEITKMIRTVKPDLVVTMDPTMLYDVSSGYINHTDHRAAGQNTIDAVFPLARDHLSFPGLLSAGLEPHKVKTLLLINFTQNNYYIDISHVFDLKIRALLAHASQMPGLEADVILVRKFAESTGKSSNFDLAEGFLKIDLPR